MLGSLLGGFNLPAYLTCRVPRGKLPRPFDLTCAQICSHTLQVTHMPPELLKTGCLSKAADAFAWGVILWEMCAGQRPWMDMLDMQVTILVEQAKYHCVISLCMLTVACPVKC